MSVKPSLRIREIDSLRGIFALGVFFFHTLFRYDEFISFRSDNRVLDVINFSPEDYLGRLPVYLFFMISGFVITLSIEASPSPSAFAYGRFSRLFPAYWAAILVTSAVLVLFPVPGLGVTLRETLINFTMVHEIFDVPNVDGVYWSLYVEVCFYSFMFLVSYFGLWKYLKEILFIWIIVTIAYSFLDQTKNFVPSLIVDPLVLQYAHFFISGAVFFRIGVQKTIKIDSFLLLTLCLVSVYFHYSLGMFCVILVMFIVFLLIVFGRLKFLETQPLLYLGTISYTFYLLHQNISYSVIYNLNFPFWIEIALSLVVSILLASSITFLIERPAQKLLRRIKEKYS
jgi:peptidoglycan/LPS O-acetylase OafA/YrhL